MSSISDVINELVHTGMPRRSGRYPWGSGKDPHQHSGDFLSRVNKLKKEGLSEVEIAKQLGFVDEKTGQTKTTDLRVYSSIAQNERRMVLVNRAKALADKGYSPTEIAKEMGYNNESSVRSLLNKDAEAKTMLSRNTADFIKKHVDEKGMILIGAGIEGELGVSREKLIQALYILEAEGYPVYGGGIPQITNPGKQTNVKVVCPPGTPHSAIFNFADINTIQNYTSHDDGQTFDTLKFPKSMDSKRIHVNYAEDGGVHKDGVVEIRRGVKDLSLGNSHYAQVRILVDGTKYIKGMAMYSDNMPDGADIVFNTNKKRGTPVHDVLKDIKSDPSNPFGALIKANGQSYYDDPNGEFTNPTTGKKQSLSVINKTREEGDWDEWSKGLPSQFLSKQNKTLIKSQLDMAYADKYAEFDEIMSVPNPTLKKKLLKAFSDGCDAATVHLKAAALPGQKYRVILPISTLSDKEVFAPGYENGERLALIRYPHGGTFEIPTLVVNNKHKDALRILGPNPADAIGINSKVAEQLSGADFDGDTVMTIPITSKVRITARPKLKELENFDPKLSYQYTRKEPGPLDDKGRETTRYFRGDKEIKVMKNTQTEMGVISNLITDMTLKGASDDKIARAVRHSMVIIDAEKHKLDYKQSELDNNIAALKKEWQGHIGSDGQYHEGASTLISLAKNEVRIPKTIGSPQIDKDTGVQTFKQNPKTYVDSKGVTKYREETSTRMAVTSDARTLSSGTVQEELYANYANQLKSLANKARKEMVKPETIPYRKAAKETYLTEVKSLEAQLSNAKRNAPKEQKAQIIANANYEAKRLEYPDMDKKELKKLRQQELNRARISVGAKRQEIEISDREWEAIQSGAISPNRLKDILNYVDLDKLKERAMPRSMSSVSVAKQNKIKSMVASGYTTVEIAKAVGVSTSSVSKYVRGKE